MATLDFSKCKTPEDVQNVVERSSAFRVISHFEKVRREELLREKLLAEGWKLVGGQWVPPAGVKHKGAASSYYSNTGGAK